LPHARDWETAAPKGTAAGAYQRADSVTFSQVWRRGGKVSVVRRAGQHAIAVARQPNLGQTKVPSRDPTGMATQSREISLTNARQIVGNA